MAQRIPEETIEEIRTSADIVEVVNEYVQLTKQGRNYTGLCPFHGENTPSFSVSSDRQLYHCFGCGAGGNVINFIMESEGISFIEAIQLLAEKTGVSLPETIAAAKEGNDSGHQAMLDGHELAARFYHHILMNTNQGQEAYDYLLSRGVSEDMMKHFQIGYAPAQHQALTALLEKREYKLAEMKEAGLVMQSESSGEYFDRFIGRIIFPIQNGKGKVIAFGGRTLTNDGPKYLNSSESAIFKKNETLYGLAAARPFIRKHNLAVLFEGYMDVIAASSAGINTGIATLGTSLTEQQARTIRRNSEEVTVCYDGDEAGITAAIKAATLLEAEGCKVRVALLEDGEDPDDFIQKAGPERFKQEIIEAAVPVMTFKMNVLRRNKNLKNEGERLAYIEEVLGELTNIQGAVEREHYMRQLAEEFSLSLEALKHEQSRLYRKKKRQQNENVAYESAEKRSFSFKETKLRSAFENAERYLLAHMMNSYSITKTVEKEVGAEFNVEEYAALAVYLYGYYGRGLEPDPAHFIHSINDEELTRLATELAMIEIPDHITDDELMDYMKKIKNYPKWVEIEQKEKEMREAERKNDVTTALYIANEVISLRKELTY
ncbi:DNA primase [Salsuginibacillus kocurii]|uniref:DNA primase n=1 Tax=Salsuginibacillus kocurii TaxID=427078 RepID=UPI00036E62A7|nr:DNA primase [Salsuginibacillus kocurii]